MTDTLSREARAAVDAWDRFATDPKLASMHPDWMTQACPPGYRMQQYGDTLYPFLRYPTQDPAAGDLIAYRPQMGASAPMLVRVLAVDQRSARYGVLNADVAPGYLASAIGEALRQEAHQLATSTLDVQAWRTHFGIGALIHTVSADESQAPPCVWPLLGRDHDLRPL